MDQERRGCLRLAAKGRMTDEELDEALLELEQTRRTVEQELAAVRGRHEEVEALERDRDALKASWAAAVPGDLERLTPEGRNGLYHALRLEISPREGGGYVVTGPFVTDQMCTFEPSPSSRSLTTTRIPPRRRFF